MSKRSIVFFIISLLFFFGANSQNITHKVYLKNGSIVTGKIIENIAGSHIKVKCKDGNIWAFKESEIEKTEEYKKHLSFLYTDLGLGLTISDQVNGEFGLSFGYKFNKRYSAGISTGYDWISLNSPYINRGGVPFQVEGRFNFFPDKDWGLQFALKTGYLFINQRYYDRPDVSFMLNPCLNILTNTEEGNGLYIGAGYRFQYFKTDGWYYWGAESSTIEYYFNRVNIKFGYIF